MAKNINQDIKHIISFKLTPKQAIEYLKQKGYKLSFNYNELMHEAHHKAFTVAKIQRLDLLYDIKESILTAQKQGLSFNSWKKNIKPILIKKGWWGEVEAIDKSTGEVKNITVGTKRLKTIFYTNNRVAYQTAKAKKYYEDESVTYLRYIAILDNRVRPSHKAMHGTILPKNHPFWEQNFPPNGWNCRCRVRAVSKFSEGKYQDKIKESLALAKQNPLIADKDFAYDIREGRFFDRFKGSNVETKAFATYKAFNLASAKELNRSQLPEAPAKLPKAKNNTEALAILESTLLQGKKTNTIKTPITDILIDKASIEHIILDHPRKDAREQYANFIKLTLQEPDEIWAIKERDKDVESYYKKRYNYIKLFKSKKDNILVVVKLLRDFRFKLVTFLKTKDFKYIDKQRAGVLMYKKDTNTKEGTGLE